MTIFMESFQRACERDGAAEADAGFFVGSLLADPEKGLKKNELGIVRGENQNVIVAFAELRGDREFALDDDGLLKQAFDFGSIEASEVDFIASEFSQDRGEFLFVRLSEFGEFVVG